MIPLYRHWKWDLAILLTILVAIVKFSLTPYHHPGLIRHSIPYPFPPEVSSHDDLPEWLSAPHFFQWINGWEYVQLCVSPIDQQLFFRKISLHQENIPLDIPPDDTRSKDIRWVGAHLPAYGASLDFFMWRVSPDGGKALWITLVEGESRRFVADFVSGEVREFENPVVDASTREGYGLNYFESMGWMMDSRRWFEVSDGSVISMYDLEAGSLPVWVGGGSSAKLVENMRGRPVSVGRIWNVRPDREDRLVGLWKNRGPYRPYWRQFYPEKSEAAGKEDSFFGSGQPLDDGQQFLAVDIQFGRIPEVRIQFSLDDPVYFGRSRDHMVNLYRAENEQAIPIKTFLNIRNFNPEFGYAFSADWQNVVIFQKSQALLIPLSGMTFRE